MAIFATPTPISATIDIIAGDIRVIASDRADTVVEVRPRDQSNQLDVKTAAQTRVDLVDGKLTVKSPKPLQVFFSGKSATVDVTVELPAGSHVRGTTMQGELSCEGRIGACALRTYDGDISLHQAESLRLTTTNGRITANRVTGDAHVTGSGEVQLTEVGGAAYVKNLDGPSWIGQVGGDVHVNSAHGDITIGRSGPQVVARTAHGSVRLAEVARGTAVLQTASGDVEVGVCHGTAAWLDVKSSYGSVRNELETTGGPQGPENTVQIRARTWDGDIVIRRAA
jgi:DUF4097 and DUF4098 domain-containing protein YvlB